MKHNWCKFCFIALCKYWYVWFFMVICFSVDIRWSASCPGWSDMFQERNGQEYVSRKKKINFVRDCSTKSCFSTFPLWSKWFLSMQYYPLNYESRSLNKIKQMKSQDSLRSSLEISQREPGAICISKLRLVHEDFNWTRGNFKWTRGNFQNTLQC